MKWTWRLSLATIILAGVWLRFWRLETQIPLGDEWWTLRAAVKHSAGYLIAHHHGNDYSIPLALWNRLMLTSIGLSEWSMRLPVAVTGCLVLPLAWTYSRRWTDPMTAATITALFALSPILLLYSRFARPYIGVVLASFVALIAWIRWLETGDRRSGVLAALGAGVAVFLNAVGIGSRRCVSENADNPLGFRRSTQQTHLVCLQGNGNSTSFEAAG
jgi:predicted membrane-bound mannosyltransferase